MNRSLLLHAEYLCQIYEYLRRQNEKEVQADTAKVPLEVPGNDNNLSVAVSSVLFARVEAGDFKNWPARSATHITIMSSVTTFHLRMEFNFSLIMNITNEMQLRVYIGI